MQHPQIPKLLVVDDDPDILETLEQLLTDEGYALHLATSLDEALTLIDTQSFDFILTDLFGPLTASAIPSIRPLVEKAYPTPVAVCSARKTVTTEDRTGLAFVAEKPFDLQELLTQIAAALQAPLPEHDPRTVLAVQYFAALSAKDWDALLRLCTPDIVYVVPGESSWSHTITGHTAFRQFSAHTFQQFADARFTNIRVYPTPKGMAARYVVQWSGSDKTPVHLTGAVVFHVEGQMIHRIGIQTNTDRLPPPQTP